MFAPLIFFWGASRGKAVRSGGVHGIFLIKNMNFFILNTLCTSRIHFVVREAWWNYVQFKKLSTRESFFELPIF